jgi:hypothetical protein
VSAWGRKPPLTGGAHLLGGTGARVHGPAGLDGLAWAALAFSFSLDFLIAFPLLFPLGFSIQIQITFQIQTNSTMCNNSKNI